MYGSPDSFPDRYSESTFSAASIRWFKDADQKYHILEAIQDGSYQEEVERYAKEEIILSEEQIHKYLVYDFDNLWVHCAGKYFLCGIPCGILV